MKNIKHLSRKRSRRGMSMVEVMITTIIASIMSIALVGSLVMNLSSHRANRSYNRNMDAGNTAMQRVVYGFGANDGLREVAIANVSIIDTAPGWRIETGNGDFLRYDPATQIIEDQDAVVYAQDVVSAYARWNGSSSGILLGLQVQDNSLKQPVVQTLESLVKFRN